ncbi:MAG: universal stress protein [Rhodospirillaceae bacterium]|nr:universal stress protein [Rhodospirillaceae bacterium]MYB15237.1 universal stress protein [Rhodospirillaceae bacterium]MYI50752.1 universal stress protein [Rhodospirillaceae bacterium]
MAGEASRKPPETGEPALRDSESPTDVPETGGPPRFSILVCIDGTDASYLALRHAVRIGSATDADLTLLYVRPIDRDLQTGGMQISVVRENLLDWGLEMPGATALRRGRELLVELGWLDKDWQTEFAHVDVQGDPLGDNAIVYSSPKGRSVVLRLLIAPSVAAGILDEAKLGEFDLLIVGMSEGEKGSGPGYVSRKIARRVAREHTGAVLVTRAREDGDGHLVCVASYEGSIVAAQKHAEIASLCAAPVFLLSVARTVDFLPDSKKSAATAKERIEKAGIPVSGTTALVGDPVALIVEQGRPHSLIVVSRFQKRTGWRQIFSNSIAFKVLKHAENSVMITR